MTTEITTVKSTVRLTTTVNQAIKGVFYLYKIDSVVITKFQGGEKRPQRLQYIRTFIREVVVQRSRNEITYKRSGEHKPPKNQQNGRVFRKRCR